MASFQLELRIRNTARAGGHPNSSAETALRIDRTIPPSHFQVLLAASASGRAYDSLRTKLKNQEQERGVNISKRADRNRPLFDIVKSTLGLGRARPAADAVCRRTFDRAARFSAWREDVLGQRR